MPNHENLNLQNETSMWYLVLQFNEYKGNFPKMHVNINQDRLPEYFILLLVIDFIHNYIGILSS